MDKYGFVYFQVEPNTKLFPAVFVLPTSANLFQFEFVKIKVCFCPNQTTLYTVLSTFHQVMKQLCTLSSSH